MNDLATLDDYLSFDETPDECILMSDSAGFLHSMMLSFHRSD